MSSRWIKEFDVNLNLLRSTERLNSLNIYSLDFLTDTQYVSIEDDTYKLTLSSFGVYYSSLGDSEIIYNSSRPQSRFVFIRPEGSLFCGGVVALSSELKDNSIDYDKLEFLQQAGGGGQIDYTSVLSNIATNLLNISNAVQPLTSLTNLTQLANIVSAISSQDNQSQIVSMLNKLRGVFTNGQPSSSDIVSDNYKLFNKIFEKNNQSDIVSMLNKLRGVFISSHLSEEALPDVTQKYLYVIAQSLNAYTTGSSSSATLKSGNVINRLDKINSSLENIETKLEQNLPFCTVVENEIVETNISQNCNYSSKIEQIPFSE